MAKLSLRLFKVMMMVNIKAAIQILKKSLHWKHPILQYNAHHMHCGHYYH